MAYKPVTNFPTRDITQLHPKVKSMVLLWMAECKKAGILVGISQTYRSKDYQSKLHKENPDGAAAPNMSMHQYRCAVDFYINMKGKSAYDAELIRKCGLIAEKLGFVWGGRFKHYDGCHIQYTKPWSEKQIRAGKIPA